MSGKREVPGLADMIATVISPVLIMAMVGSLIYFLIEVLYGGDYSSNLRYTFTFFVFGAVLIARIAIEMGDAKASLYALALGGATFIAMLRFVSYPEGFLGEFAWLVNIGLLVLVWWCARKLTWDCTHIDDQRDASDHSVLEAAGLDALERPAEWREPEPEADVRTKKKKHLPGIHGVWQRYAEYRKAQDKKPHTPGVWVVYFSLAALPIFGLGQSLIPATDQESRRYTFWLMAVYVASGMGLLMTTSFLGLRRYLKQRKIRIPAKMATIWLGVGSGLIFLFLVVAAALPRPNSETALIKFSGAGSKDREASNYAMREEGAGKGEGAGGEKSSDKAESKSSAEGKSKEAGKGQGQSDSSKGNGENQGKGGNSGKSKQQGNQKGGEKSDRSKGDPGNDQKSDQAKKDEESKEKSQTGPASNSQRSESRRSRSSSSSGQSPRGPISLGSLGKLGVILKWLVFGALALIVAFYVFRHGLKFLANFSDWAKQLLESLRNFWANLFGRRDEEESEPAPAPAPVARRPRPFADFANPFDTGSASQQSPAELVRYSFSALEAFAWEHERERLPDETPLEFAARMAQASPELEQDAPRLAALYARLAYARGSLPEAAKEHVREFWRQLELAHEEALTERKVQTVPS
jgi:hypothetical protein